MAGQLSDDLGLPETFPIGTGAFSPLVVLEEIEDHLNLLLAISRLKENVLAAYDHQDEHPGLKTREEAWVVYVNRAVYRFYRWVKSLKDPLPQHLDHMPPLDVVMVWHTYLLVRYHFTWIYLTH